MFSDEIKKRIPNEEKMIQPILEQPGRRQACREEMRDNQEDTKKIRRLWCPKVKEGSKGETGNNIKVCRCTKEDDT